MWLFATTAGEQAISKEQRIDAHYGAKQVKQKTLAVEWFHNV